MTAGATVVTTAIREVANTSGTNYATNATSLAPVSGGYFGRFLAITNLTGAVTGTNTVTIAVVKCPNTSLTSVTVISSNVYTGTNANDVVDLQELNDVYFDSTNPYIAVKIDTTGIVTAVSSNILGGDDNYGTAATYNIAAVSGTVQAQ